jgi:hypothetical protein
MPVGCAPPLNKTFALLLYGGGAGKLREDRGDYGGARAEYVRAVAACPGSAGARHHLGKMLRVCANGEVRPRVSKAGGGGCRGKAY